MHINVRRLLVNVFMRVYVVSAMYGRVAYSTSLDYRPSKSSSHAHLKIVLHSTIMPHLRTSKYSENCWPSTPPPVLASIVKPAFRRRVSTCTEFSLQ